MEEPVFTGVGVALVTLFDDRGELDAPATAALAVQLVELGVRGVVVAGSTGEAATLGRDERIQLVETVRREVPAAVPVLAGTGAPSARQAATLTADAVDHGADAVLALSPPRALELARYYEAVAAAAGDRPVLAYHFPAVSPPGIPVECLASLPLAGLKDSSGEPARLLAELAVFEGRGRALYTGSSSILSFAGPLGCAGAILSLANAEPERCIAALAGDAAAQRDLYQGHVAAHERFPEGIKGLVAARFGTSTVCRF